MVKIAFDVPKKMMEVAQAPDAHTKPYDVCLHCPFISESCDGPNVLAMEYPRWVDWANARAKQLGLTRADIAEQSGVPVGTVNNAMSGRNADVRTSTLRDITKVLIGGCWGQYPCHFASLLINDELTEDDGQTDALAQELHDAREELETANAELNQLRQKVAAFEDLKKSDISEAKDEAQRKVDFLTQQIAFKDTQIVNKDKIITGKERTIGLLAVILGVLVVAVLAVLLYDALNPNIGFFRY